MTWYTAHYGSWKDPHGVRYIPGTYDRKEIFSQAQDTANRLNSTVTIDEQRGSPNGLHHRFYEITPQKEETQ